MNYRENHDEYQLVNDQDQTVAMGTRDLMFRFLKHHVPDGRYRIVGPKLRLHCVRKDGVVDQDPDGVWLQKRKR